MTTEIPLIPATGQALKGIERRRDIRRLWAEGKTQYQICHELSIGLTALRRHLKKIAEEDSQAGAA